jgi:hypothetical protein
VTRKNRSSASVSRTGLQQHTEKEDPRRDKMAGRQRRGYLPPLITSPQKPTIVQQQCSCACGYVYCVYRLGG